MNDFQTDLIYSEDDEIFNAFYYKTFLDIERIEFMKVLEEQKKGIDKIIYFKSGNFVTVDEKKRRTDYGDILLEYWSVLEYQKKGWVFTDQCDYIVYGIMPTKKVYLLPVVLLKIAWNRNYQEWFSKYSTINAYNKTYTTQSLAIPVNVLLDSIHKEMYQEL